MGCMSGSSESQSSSGTTKTQRKATDWAVNKYKGYMKEGPNVYQGERVAPLTGGQQDLLGYLERGAKDYAAGNNQFQNDPLYQQGKGVMSGALAGQLGATPLTFGQAQDYYKQVIEQPTLDQFYSDVMPGVKEAYSGPGYWGGARAQAQSGATEDVFSTLGQQRAQLGWDVLGRNQQLAEQQANRQMQAAAGVGEYLDLPSKLFASNTANVGQYLSTLGIGQAQEQNEINAAMQKFIEETEKTDPRVAQYFLSLLNVSNPTSSGSSSGPGLGNTLLSSFASKFGGAAGITAGAAIFK